MTQKQRRLARGKDKVKAEQGEEQRDKDPSSDKRKIASEDNVMWSMYPDIQELDVVKCTTTQFPTSKELYMETILWGP